MPQPQDKLFTELDLDLQRLAAIDWPTFVQLVGESAIIKAKVCLLKTRGKSQQQISNRLDITINQARHGCEICPSVKSEFL